MYRIGIDIGGTATKVAFISEQAEMVYKTSIPTRCGLGYEQVFADIAHCLEAGLQTVNATKDEIGSIGLAIPGLVSEDGSRIVFASNLGFVDVDAQGCLQPYFDGSRITLTNDANAAALGEHLFGAAKGSQSSVTITIGTGVCSGIIINDRLVTGRFNSGAEIGHTIVDANGERCPCGQNGCLELYASASAIIRHAKQEMQDTPDSRMLSLVNGDIDALNAKTVYDAYRSGDKAAGRVIDRFIKYLGIGVINTINSLQPEVIVIGGGISAQKENLTGPLTNYVKGHLLFGEKNLKTKIVYALLGNDAGVMGAAML